MVRRSTYHAGLSREAVLEAAVELLLADGLSGFSLRKLAAVLQVDAMSIYAHVRNKDDLLEGALALAIQPARPPGSGEWWEQVGHVMREHRKAMLKHPWALDVAMHRRLQSAEVWSGAEETLALLRSSLTPARAARWLQLLLAYTNGFLFAETEQRRPGFQQATEELESGSPLVADAARRSARNADRDFEVGLQALVSAMRQEGGSKGR